MAVELGWSDGELSLSQKLKTDVIRLKVKYKCKWFYT